MIGTCTHLNFALKGHDSVKGLIKSLMPLVIPPPSPPRLASSVPKPHTPGLPRSPDCFQHYVTVMPRHCANFILNNITICVMSKVIHDGFENFTLQW